MKICKHCNLTYTDDNQFCPQCGGALTDEQTIVCANCGQALKNNDPFCPNCGAKVDNNNIPPTPLQQNSTEIPEVNNNQISQGEASAKGKEPVQGEDPTHGEAPTPKKETHYFLYVSMVVILSVIGSFIFFLSRSLTPKEAVDKSLEEGDCTPIIELYKNTDAKEKSKIAYEIAQHYFDKAAVIFKQCDHKELEKFSKSLEKLNIDNGHNEYLGILFRLKELCQAIDSDLQQADTLGKEFEQKYHEKITDYANPEENVIQKSVYISQHLGDDVYAMYEYDSIPKYDYNYSPFFGMVSTKTGSTPIPTDECIGVIKAKNRAHFETEGVYTVTMIKTRETMKLEKKLTGFVQNVPVYVAVTNDMKDFLSKYNHYAVLADKTSNEHYQLIVKASNELSELNNTLEILKKMYGNKDIHSLKFLGGNNELKSKSGEEWYGWDLTTPTKTMKSISPVKKTTPHGFVCENGISYNETLSGKSLSYAIVTDGQSRSYPIYIGFDIHLGRDKQTVLDQLNNSEYYCLSDKTSKVKYLMPNAQVLDLTFAEVNGTPLALYRISFEKDIKQSRATGARNDNSKNTTPPKTATNRTSSNAKAGEGVYVGTYSDDGSDAYIMTQSIHISSRNPYAFTCTIKATGDLLKYKFYPKNGSPYYENSEGYHAFVFGGQSPVAENIYRYVINNY